MFKKSEEQEWTRFRGALSKDRDETGGAQTVSDANDAAVVATPATGGGQPGAGPTFRSSSSDVNVGLPTSRVTRGPAPDGVDVESLIGERSSFEGTLKTEGPVRLMGSIQGEIESKSMIIVEERAHVTARLTAAHVSVAGHVDGQMYCEGRVEIRPTGRVTGEINAGALIVQEGAYFDGNSKMAVPGASSSGTASSSSSSSSATASSSASSAAPSSGTASGTASGGASGAAAGPRAAEAATPRA